MNFVVAFLAEAQPVIDFYRLVKTDVSSGSIFKNDQHYLIISGLGKDRAATATKLLGESKARKNEGWLNLGIAGHGSHAKGDAFIAGKIIDDKNEEVFYPPPICQSALQVSSLCTCSSPMTQYEPEMGYDMEAHSFYREASKFSFRELVQVVKVVSDTPSQPIEKIRPQEATEMIASHMNQLDRLVRQIDQLALEVQPDEQIEKVVKEILSLHHFSVTRTHQLLELLRHAKMLGVDLDEIKNLVSLSPDAKQALEKIKIRIEPHRKLG
jgi:adenosylhomocysteine nucleosidase